MRSKNQIKLYLLFVLLTLTQARGFALGVDDFQARTYQDANGKTLNYRLFIPKNYKKGEKYPLILFLHGSGERGSDNQKQVGYFGASVFADDFTQATHPCFLVAPQCPERDSWAKISGTKQDAEFAPAPTEPMRLTLETLTALQKEFSIDTNRLYITGLSMGGYGTWDALARNPGRFAAAIPICGGGDPATAKRFANTPIWDFHGFDDPAVPVARSYHMMIALGDAGALPQLTVYPGVGHNSWEKAYREPRLADWLFSQHLPLPQAPRNAPHDKLILADKKTFADAGLIAVWRADKTNGKAIRDLSKNHNDLTLINGQMAIQENNVLNFTDTQPILTFEPKPGSGLEDAFTLAAWFRVDAGHYEPETLFVLETGAGADVSRHTIQLDQAHYLHYSFGSTKVFSSARIYYVGDRAGPDTFMQNNTGIDGILSEVVFMGWHHIAITFSDNKLRTYVDGSLTETIYGANLSKLAGAFRVLQIGGGQGENPFFGRMNDIRLYNRALGDSEIGIRLYGVKVFLLH